MPRKKEERHVVPHRPPPPRFPGPPALLASDPGRSHRERVGSDARSALIWPREARRLHTLQSQPCSQPFSVLKCSSSSWIAERPSSN